MQSHNDGFSLDILSSDTEKNHRSITHPARKKRIALVAQGGGQRGIFTSGVLDSFLDAGFDPFELFIGTSAVSEHDTDYCEMFGEDDIQGKKHGFLAGNNVYYIGGFFASQNLHENETIGLTHPFFHDHRSRGTGITYYEGVGTGNDFYGWEFYKQTKIAYG